MGMMMGTLTMVVMEEGQGDTQGRVFAIRSKSGTSFVESSIETIRGGWTQYAIRANRDKARYTTEADDGHITGIGDPKPRWIRLSISRTRSLGKAKGDL